VKDLLNRARNLNRGQRRMAAAALVGLLLLVPALPVAVAVVAATVAVWAAAQPLLVGIALGAVGWHRHRKLVAK
jgi:hypothetical protein